MNADNITYIVVGLMVLGLVGWFILKSKSKNKVITTIQDGIALVNNEIFQYAVDGADSRDLMYTAKNLDNLPDRVDPRPNIAAPMHQNGLNACVPMAAVGAMENNDIRSGKPFTAYAPMFVYYNALMKKNEGHNTVTGRTVLKVLSEKGVCSEQLWPYDVSKINTKPSPEAYEDALKHKIGPYFRIEESLKYKRLAGLKDALADGKYVMFGIVAHDNIRSDRLAANGGVLDMPGPHDKELGKHVMLAIGYDDSRRKIIAVGSAGPTWADHGIVYVDYGYAELQGYGHDFWVIT